MNPSFLFTIISRHLLNLKTSQICQWIFRLPERILEQHTISAFKRMPKVLFIRVEMIQSKLRSRRKMHLHVVLRLVVVIQLWNLLEISKVFCRTETSSAFSKVIPFELLQIVTLWTFRNGVRELVAVKAAPQASLWCVWIGVMLQLVELRSALTVWLARIWLP